MRKHYLDRLIPLLLFVNLTYSLDINFASKHGYLVKVIVDDYINPKFRPSEKNNKFTFVDHKQQSLFSLKKKGENNIDYSSIPKYTDRFYVTTKHLTRLEVLKDDYGYVDSFADLKYSVSHGKKMTILPKNEDKEIDEVNTTRMKK